MRLGADELAGLLRAHAYVQVQRPPILWDLRTESLGAFVRLMGEFLAAGLARNGIDLGALRLNVANVHVAPDAADPIPVGEYVAITVAGPGRWTDARWQPGAAEQLLTFDLTVALRASGALYSYSRMTNADDGSVTALFARHLPPSDAPTPES
jgi:hypothetical protein